MMQLKKIMRNRFRNNKGFTMIEIISVLVILSIIAVVVISRGGSSAEATLKSSAEALKGHIRFAQMKALNSDAPSCAGSYGLIMSGTSYSMFSATGPSDCSRTNVVLPGASSSSGVTLPNGVEFTETTRFSFDRWGRPYIVVNTPSNGDGTGNSATITVYLKYSGLPDEEITITKNTGYVP